MSLSGFCKQPTTIHYPYETFANNDNSCFGGAAIAIGIWTYGYNIMRNLGNRLTLHSPSRGFSMELGSAITVILATQLSKNPLI
jgi:phosphate/sulfate permease